MNPAAKSKVFALSIIALTIGAIALLNSCGQVQSQESESIKIDGSSTVYPITDAMAKEYQNTHPKKAKILVSSVGYIPLPKEGYHLIYQHFYNGKVGTVFGGKAQIDSTIGELLRKQATF
jgi:hypothetical protein